MSDYASEPLPATPEPSPPEMTFRPARWLRIWSWLTLTAIFVLFILGQLVTSFQAGMADPLWPTEPWYLLLIDWREPSPGYLIEHSHRIVGFLVGGLTAVLTLGLWWTHPRWTSRGLALVLWLLLLTAYGQFHAALLAQRQATPEAVQWPRLPTALTLLAAVLYAAMAAWDAIRKVPGSAARLLGLLSLLAVMIQGLLGGFRVLWDALAGTDLAAVHGVFAQCVLGLLTATAFLTCVMPTKAELFAADVHRFRYRSALFALMVFVQIVLGAWLRHHIDPLAQRLHVLTAFAVFGAAVWLGTQLLAVKGAWRSVRYLSIAVAVVLTVQVYLGVESWMVRYGAGVPPELAPNTVVSAAWRTAHALTGSLLWTLSLALSLHWLRCRNDQTHCCLNVNMGRYTASIELVASDPSQPLQVRYR